MKAYAVVSLDVPETSLEPSQVITFLRLSLGPWKDADDVYERKIEYIGTKKPVVSLGEKYRDTAPDELTPFDTFTQDFPAMSKAIADVMHEIANARRKFPAHKSAHEGYAIILEELDELWEEVRQKNDKRGRDNIIAMRKEAMQVAAMAIAFMVECAQ